MITSLLDGKIKMINDEIVTLTHFALAGELEKSIDISKYSGDWSELMNAIAMPMNEATNVLQHISEGNFNHMVKGNYQGDFLSIKNAIYETVTNIASYINEISKTLSAISENDN